MAAVLTYAIGDIHGSYGKLASLLRHCADHCGDNDPRIVFLGDYVDRGEGSREVVTLLMETQAAAPAEVICLMGNHEDMLLAAANRQDEAMWLDNGGGATLESYGVSSAQDIPGEHLAWFERLPLSSRDERRFFVHAGIMPGIPLEQQRREVDAVDPRALPVARNRPRTLHRARPHADQNGTARALPQPAQSRHARLERQSAVRRRL
jgi:Calcineurin-like phosphoesterase